MQIKLLVKSIDKSNHTIINLSKDYCIIGRKDADLLIKDDTCSKQHALLYQSFQGTLQLKDLSSKNGTYLNNVRISDAKVSIGDSIKIGKALITVLEFVPTKISKNIMKIENKSSYKKEHSDTKTNFGSAVVHEWPEKFKANPKKRQPEFIYFIDEEGTKNRINISSLKAKKS